MSKTHFICRCHDCGGVWDMDYQGEACVCQEPDTSPEGCTITVVEADDYQTALASVTGESS